VKYMTLRAFLVLMLGASSGAWAGTIEYIAHACFVIESDAGERVLIDPFASRIWLGYDFPELPPVDGVVVTHPHYDHDAGRYRGQPWPWDAAVRVFDRPGEAWLGGIRILGVAGKHADPYGKEFGQLNTIFRIEVDGLSIVHVGDNGPLTEENYRDLRPVDVLMVPADSLVHILKNREIEAIVAALEPQVVIPMHYRIPELERDPGSPDGLGGIEAWLVGRENVWRMKNNIWSPELLPEARGDGPAVIVLPPSPSVVRPGADTD
jgi:L-ascorbate metabolism protein UlaG (beta-lactamase superfamily)